jgi:hypothetical protein
MDNSINNIELIATAALLLPTEENTAMTPSVVLATNRLDPDSSDKDIDVPSNTQATTSNITNAASIVATSSAGKRGPVYTATEELLACKAFIAASEDALVGASQKGKQFKFKMFTICNLILKEQEQIEQQRLSARSVSPLPLVYEWRSPDAIYDRFKLVSHECSKLLGVEKTTVMESGWDQVKFDAGVDYHLE